MLQARHPDSIRRSRPELRRQWAKGVIVISSLSVGVRRERRDDTAVRDRAAPAGGDERVQLPAQRRQTRDLALTLAERVAGERIDRRAAPAPTVGQRHTRAPEA